MNSTMPVTANMSLNACAARVVGEDLAICWRALSYKPATNALRLGWVGDAARAWPLVLVLARAGTAAWENTAAAGALAEAGPVRSAVFIGVTMAPATAPGAVVTSTLGADRFRLVVDVVAKGVVAEPVAVGIARVTEVLNTQAYLFKHGLHSHVPAA